MKAFVLSALFALSASAAQAAPLNCTTNVNHDPRAASTSLTIKYRAGVTTVSQITAGGMAHFVTAPKTFTVSVTHEGPEMATYSNSEEGFELSVVFQPIGFEIRGTLITEVFGQRINEPVVCAAAMN